MTTISPESVHRKVGAGVLGDLHTQRETIQRSRSRLKDIEGGLGEVKVCITPKTPPPPLSELKHPGEDDVESPAEQVDLGRSGRCCAPSRLLHHLPPRDNLTLDVWDATLSTTSSQRDNLD